MGAGDGGEWTEEEEVGPKQLLPLKFLSVPETARLAGIEQFGRIEWDRNSAEDQGWGGGWGWGHLDQRLWSFGKAVPRGKDLETSG